MKKVFYPKCGMSNLVNCLSDLYIDDIQKKRGVIVNTSAQPNSYPHIGTLITIMSSFAIAELIKKVCGINVVVEFDYLENSPAKVIEKSGLKYSLSLKYANNKNGERLDDILSSYIMILDFLKNETNISYRLSSYLEFQKNGYFREGVLKVIDNKDLQKVLDPKDGTVKFRIECPKCRFVDKGGDFLAFECADDSIAFSSSCFEHGAFSEVVSKGGSGYIDTNTPLRAVLKGYTLAKRSVYENNLFIMLDGKDWSGAWLKDVFLAGTSCLGVSTSELPKRLFSPTITDWSGAKFSKSVYIDHDISEIENSCFFNVNDIVKKYGEESLLTLLTEVRSWIGSPVKFFRDYSIEYISSILDKKESYTNDL